MRYLILDDGQRIPLIALPAVGTMIQDRDSGMEIRVDLGSQLLMTAMDLELRAIATATGRTGGTLSAIAFQFMKPAVDIEWEMALIERGIQDKTLNIPGEFELPSYPYYRTAFNMMQAVRGGNYQPIAVVRAIGGNVQYCLIPPLFNIVEE